MADDGMLLNFDLGDGILKAKPAFSGGSWKDRWSAKKSRRTKGTTANNNPVGARKPSEHSDPDSGSRNAKRQKFDGSHRPERPFVPSQNDSVKQPVVSAAWKPKEIVSSLFTYNPKATTQPESSVRNDDPVEPSNAPLSSKLDTFTSLGLSSLLAGHLLTKMDLKAPTAIQKTAISQLLKEDSDAFVQAETGSGKTLAYLLPIVQRIMKLSEFIKEANTEEKEAIDRKSGLFAIILAPTRELSKQIQVVLESLLRCAHWIVSGIVIGGEKKQSEKARLRKGVNILVATPGRLADHLQNTEALDVSNVRWLVLDEGDRLMELGFENDIQKIVGVLNLRLKAAAHKVKIPGLPEKRTTVLCSATLKVDVQRLGEISLKDAVHIQKDPTVHAAESSPTNGTQAEDFSAPAQLKQSYAIVPAKLRLVSLVAYLKKAFERKGSVMKAIVFISCADSVDFHFDALTRVLPSKDTNSKASEQKDDKKEDDSDASPNAQSKTKKIPKAFMKRPDPSIITHASSALISSKDNDVTIYRLHGSLAQALRTSTVNRFSKSKEPSVLLATDVASRGLDVPNVDVVLEYDPAFSRDDHIHRIGRTARAGKNGRSCVFLMPGCEEKYIDVLARDRKDKEGGGHLLQQTGEDILKKAFQPNKPIPKVSKNQTEAWDAVATELQLQIERWILESDHPARFEAAKKAFQGHVRAYATHISAERDCFDIKELHLGHLAKAFALRERPGGLGGLERRVGAGSASAKKGKRALANSKGHEKRSRAEVDDVDDVNEAVLKMRAKIKQQKMLGMGASEFNLG